MGSASWHWCPHWTGTQAYGDGHQLASVGYLEGFSEVCTGNIKKVLKPEPPAAWNQSLCSKWSAISRALLTGSGNKGGGASPFSSVSLPISLQFPILIGPIRSQLAKENGSLQSHRPDNYTFLIKLLTWTNLFIHEKMASKLPLNCQLVHSLNCPAV